MERQPSYTEAYLANLPSHETRLAEVLADDILQSGPLPEAVAVIPVAAHQESHNIYQALSQYAGQETTEPFAVYLGLNSPQPESNPDVQASFSEIERAKHDFPDLDIRQTYLQYDDAPIGKIRRDMWNGLAIAANAKSDQYPDTTVGFNHDIDLVKMGRHYVENTTDTLQRDLYYYPDMAPLPRTTRAKHAYDPTHPNISKGVYWHDFIIRQTEEFGGFEASIAFTLGRYAVAGGFDAQARTHETANIADQGISPVVKGAVLETSPRRFIEKFADNGFSDIWTAETFSDTDVCRTDLSATPDISQDRLERHISLNLYDDIDYRIVQFSLEEAIQKTNARRQRQELVGSTAELAHDIAKRKIRLAVNVLDRVVQSPELAAYIKTIYYDSSLVADFYSSRLSQTRPLIDLGLPRSNPPSS